MIKQDFHKGFVGKNLVSNYVKINLKEYSIKQLKGDIETLGLYWFTQTELHPILLDTTIKGFTNQNLDYKEVFYPANPSYTSILYATLDTSLDSP